MALYLMCCSVPVRVYNTLCVLARKLVAHPVFPPSKRDGFWGLVLPAPSLAPPRSPPFPPPYCTMEEKAIACAASPVDNASMLAHYPYLKLERDGLAAINAKLRATVDKLAAAVKVQQGGGMVSGRAPVPRPPRRTVLTSPHLRVFCRCLQPGTCPPPSRTRAHPSVSSPCFLANCWPGRAPRGLSRRVCSQPASSCNPDVDVCPPRRVQMTASCGIAWTATRSTRFTRPTQRPAAQASARIRWRGSCPRAPRVETSWCGVPPPPALISSVTRVCYFVCPGG